MGEEVKITKEIGINGEEIICYYQKVDFECKKQISFIEEEIKLNN